MQNLDEIYESTKKAVDIALKRAIYLQIKDSVPASYTGINQLF